MMHDVKLQVKGLALESVLGWCMEVHLHGAVFFCQLVCIVFHLEPAFDDVDLRRGGVIDVCVVETFQGKELFWYQVSGCDIDWRLVLLCQILDVQSRWKQASLGCQGEEENE